MEQGRVAVLVHSTLSHCQKHAYQEWSHWNLWWQSYGQDKKCFIKSKGNNSKPVQGRVKVLVHCTSSQCPKHAYHVWSHLKLWWQSYAPDKESKTSRTRTTPTRTQTPPTKVIRICSLFRRHTHKEHWISTIKWMFWVDLYKESNKY